MFPGGGGERGWWGWCCMGFGQVLDTCSTCSTCTNLFLYESFRTLQNYEVGRATATSEVQSHCPCILRDDGLEVCKYVHLHQRNCSLFVMLVCFLLNQNALGLVLLNLELRMEDKRDS